MTGRAKRKGIETGAGLLTYIIVWAISLHVHMEKTEMTALFLVPYIILSATTYLEEIKRFRSLKFLDENLLIIAATCGALFLWQAERSGRSHAALSGGKTGGGAVSEPDEEIHCQVHRYKTGICQSERSRQRESCGTAGSAAKADHSPETRGKDPGRPRL